MNRIFKVVWNELRGGFVVCDERHASRGKAKSVKKAAIATAVAAVMGLAGPAMAGDVSETITSDSTQASFTSADGTVAVTVNEGVSLAPTGTVQFTTTGTGTTVTVTNNGNIIPVSGGVTVTAASGEAKVVNAGKMNVADNITVSGNSVTVTNTGTMNTANGLVVNGDNANVMNTGTIGATDGAGITVTGSDSTLTNRGGTITGETAAIDATSATGMTLNLVGAGSAGNITGVVNLNTDTELNVDNVKNEQLQLGASVGEVNMTQSTLTVAGDNGLLTAARLTQDGASTLGLTGNRTLAVSQLGSDVNLASDHLAQDGGKLLTISDADQKEVNVRMPNSVTNQLASTEEAKAVVAEQYDITNDKQTTTTFAEGDILGETTVIGHDENAIVRERENTFATGLKHISAMNYLTFRAQTNDVSKRMGDLRSMPQSDGAWGRVVAGQSEYKSIHNTYQTLQIGADKRIGNYYLGATASYTDGDGSLKNGSTDDKNYGFGLYGGWLGEDGQYVDVIIKRQKFESDFDLYNLSGNKMKGSYDTWGTSASVEYGWRLGIDNTAFYVEPQAEFMFGHLNGAGYKTSNGVKVRQDGIDSAVGRAGLAAGWVSPEKNGSAYIKASVLHDWEGEAETRTSKGSASRKYVEDMSGTWGEFALGGTFNITKNLAAYGEVETTVGNPVRTTYQVSGGLRYNF